MTGSSVFLIRYLAITLGKDDPKRAALILSCLDEDLATHVFEVMPEPVQTNVFRHLASGDFNENLPQDIAAILLDSVGAMLGGPKVAAEILHRTAEDTGKRILANLDRQDIQLAEDVRNQVFTFDNITRLSSRELRSGLREVDAGDLAIAMRGADENIRHHIFAHLSEDDCDLVREHMRLDAPTSPSMIEKIQDNIVCTLRRMQSVHFIVDRADQNLPV